MFLLNAMSASLGPAAVPDTVKTRRQLTFVCLRFRFSVAVWFWVLKTWKEKADGWNKKIQRVATRKLGKFQS
jgi:hypothetical protein